MNRKVRLAIACAIALTPPAVGQAQTQLPSIRVGGRLHVQGYWYDNEAHAAPSSSLGPQSNFFVRRARIQVDGRIAENVALVIQPSFENGGGREPNLRLRDAYIDVRLTPESASTSLTWRVGQEKRPFSRWELTSSNNLVVIERGAGRGLPGRQTNNLFESNGFLAHDLGTSVLLVSRDVITLQAGIYNGRGESFSDDNGAKSFGGRMTVGPLPRIAPALSLGASYFSHDGVVTLAGGGSDSSFRHDALGFDAQWGRAGNPGFYGLIEYARGTTFTEAELDIRGFMAVAAYHHRLETPASWLYAIEPAVRFDDADPNAGNPNDRSTLVSAALGLYFSSRAQFRVSYERQMFEDDAMADVGGIRTAMTVNF